MDNLHIGFIGGCINSQIGMERSDLYHTVLRETLSKKNPTADCHISLASYLSYDQMVKRTESFIAGNHLDVLFVFIRPFPLMPLQKLFIKYDEIGNKTGWAVHPAIFDRKQNWPSTFSAHQSDNGYRYVKRSKFELRDLNILAGTSLGLHRWAMSYIQKQLMHIKSLCENENVKLCIISPPRNPESLLGDMICKWATSSVADFCTKNEIQFININRLGTEYFEKDELHFNKEGHKRIAGILYDQLICEASSLHCISDSKWSIAANF